MHVQLVMQLDRRCRSVHAVRVWEADHACNCHCSTRIHAIWEITPSIRSVNLMLWIISLTTVNCLFTRSYIYEYLSNIYSVWPYLGIQGINLSFNWSPIVHSRILPHAILKPSLPTSHGTIHFAIIHSCMNPTISTNYISVHLIIVIDCHCF